MKSEIKNKAKQFLREYKLASVTLSDLRKVIPVLGYTIIEYNNIYNDENVDALISALGVESATEKSKGFTYCDRHRRLVFVHEDLSDQEKLYVLSHELGHIYLNHLSNVPIIGKDVVEEHEANEFSHYILNTSKGLSFRNFVVKRKKLLVAVLIVVLVACIGTTLFLALGSNDTPYGEFYITSTGKKYHKDACIFVKDKTNVHRITPEEFESGNYAPCEVCLPDM